MMMKLLILSVIVGPVANVAIISGRNLVQFKNMINHKGFSSLDYYGYGCWCGWGNHGSTVFDKTDECCKVHDLCYDKIDEGLFGCSPKFHVYDWKPTDNGGIICQDQIGSCYRKICDCDRFAADCYALHRKTYNLTYLDQYFPFDKREACQ